MTLPKHITGSVAIIYGPTQSGSSSLLWYLSKIREKDEFSEAVTRAESVSAGAGGLVFLPYLAGERAPIWDAEARGSFANINTNHTHPDFVRAIMEGVAFSTKHCLDVAEEALGTSADTIVISGGGSKIPLWNQIRADVNKKRVALTECQEASALGAVILAAVGIGLFRDLKEASEKLVRTAKIFEPTPEKFPFYDKNYKCYRALYKALKSANE
jgi:xylulokinase